MGVSALQNSKDPTANSQSSRYSGGERQQVLRGEFNDIMEQIVSKLKHCGLDTGYQDFAVEAPPAKLPSKVTSAEEPALTEHQAHVPNEDPPVKEGKEHANTSSVKQEESEQDETGKDDTSQVENSDVSDTVQAKSSSVEEAQTETKEGAAASEQPQEALADQASPDQDLEVPESASDETTELSLEESIEAESEEVAQLSQESSATVSKEKQTADETVIEEHDNQEQVVESKARQIDKSQQGTDQSMDQEPSLGESSERPVTPHPDLKNLSEQPQTDESLSDLASKISKELREKVAEEPVVKTEIPDVSIKAPNQDIAKQNPRAEVQNHLAAMLRAYLEQSGALNDKPQLPNVGNSNATIVQAHAVRGSSNSESKSAKSASSAQTLLPQTEKALEQTQKVLQEAARSKDGKTVSVRLDPPQLGNIKVDVSYREGTLHARVLAENPQVTQMLRERSHELQLVLRQAGIDADEVSVSVGNHGELNNSGDSSSFDKQFSDSRHGVPGGMGGDSQLAAPLSNSSGQMQVDLDHWIA